MKTVIDENLTRRSPVHFLDSANDCDADEQPSLLFDLATRPNAARYRAYLKNYENWLRSLEEPVPGPKIHP